MCHCGSLLALGKWPPTDEILVRALVLLSAPGLWPHVENNIIFQAFISPQYPCHYEQLPPVCDPRSWYHCPWYIYMWDDNVCLPAICLATLVKTNTTMLRHSSIPDLSSLFKDQFACEFGRLQTKYFLWNVTLTALLQLWLESYLLSVTPNPLSLSLVNLHMGWQCLPSTHLGWYFDQDRNVKLWHNSTHASSH